jgi:xylitol oxidase
MKLLILAIFFIYVNATPIIRIGDRLGFHPLLKFIQNRSPEYRLSNWGGNFQFGTINIYYPRSTDEVVNIVKNTQGDIKAVGHRHSFSTIADSDNVLVSTTHLNQILGLDPTVPSVTIEAGIAYTDLGPFLQVYGLGLPNLPTLAEVSVAGAAQTAAHGSGVTHKVLADQIIALKVVLANGTAVTFTKQNNPNEIAAMSVGLGAFGIITEVTLKVEPTAQYAINVFTNMTFDTLVANFDAITSAAYSVQFFFDFSDPEMMKQVWVNTRLDDDDNGNATSHLNATSFYGSVPANGQVSPIDALPSTYLVPQQGVPGDWLNRLVDYRLGLSGYNGEEIQAEYFIPWVNATKAIKALKTVGSIIRPIVYTGLFRTVAADNLWMSHSYNTKTLAIHFTLQPNMTAIAQLLPQVEAVLAPLGAVPHWGKVYYMEPKSFLHRYPKLNDWKNMVKKYDPNGRFRNDFLTKNVFIDQESNPPRPCLIKIGTRCILYG